VPVAAGQYPSASASIAGVGNARHSVLIIRDGEHLSPCIAAAVTPATHLNLRTLTHPHPP
jgi:hypothetical protein